MTYQSEVLTDSPLFYTRQDETSGTSAANAGTAGGTFTWAGTAPTRGQTPAAALDGYSVKMPTGAVASYLACASITINTTWTYETWFKKDASAATTTVDLARVHVSGTSYISITVNTSTGLFRVYDDDGTMQGGITDAAIVDGNWHHLAVVKNGTTATFYVDGVSAGTTSGTTTSKTAMFYIGAVTSAVNGGYYMDEPAFYNNSALSGTRIAAHYTAGSPPATTNVEVNPPAATMSLTAPAPVLAGSILDSDNAAPAMTLAMTAPNASGLVTESISSAVTQDRGIAGGGDLSAVSLDNNSWRPGMFYFPFPVTVGTFEELTGTGRFHFYVPSAPTATLTYEVRRLTAAFSEGGTSATLPANVTTSHTGTITAGYNSISINEVLEAWEGGATNHGIAIYVTTAFSGTAYQFQIASSEAPNSAHRPYAALDYVEAEVPVSVSVPAATLSLTAPAVSVKAQRLVSIAAPVAEATLTAIAPGVSVSAGINVAAPATTASLTFPGGESKNPDYRAVAGVAELTLNSQNANIELRYPVTNTVAGSMELTVDLDDDVEINLTTNKLSKTTPITATLRMVGIYFKEADRYLTLVGQTVDSEDVWYQMEETSGTVATDAVFSTAGSPPVTFWGQDGVYNGSPEFAVAGPHLRKAVRFDGVNDYLTLSYYEKANFGNDTPDSIIDAELRTAGGFPLTVEFSIRTTQQNGVVFAGSGARSGIAYRNSGSNAGYGPHWTGNEMVIENGELVIVATELGGYRTKVRKNIADGEWHHIVYSLPIPGNAAVTYAYVAVDGIPVAVRRDSLGDTRQMIPATFLARPGKGERQGVWTTFGLDFDNMSGFLAADLRDVIIRNNYTPIGSAQKLYYEWSDSLILHPEPITVNVSMPKPHKAKGNVKKMLCIFGLEQEFTIQQRSSTFDIYFSSLSGLRLFNAETPEQFNAYSSWTYNFPTYIERDTFRMGDFLVLPVSIEGAYPKDTILSGENTRREVAIRGTDRGAIGADGLLNGEFVDRNGHFIDDATGARRWLNVHKDLSEPLDAYDAITVMNYPWIEPNALRQYTAGFESDIDGEEGPVVRLQLSRGLTRAEWTKARDDFRDTLLEALYQGMNFWIPEIHMAMHMGFIQGYDVHTPKRFNRTNTDDYKGLPYKINQVAQALDRAHTGGISTNHPGDYWQYPQAIWHKRIVATEPGLTDMPSWHYGDMVSAYPWDDFDVKHSWLAFDIVHKPNGLTIGDKLELNLGDDEWTSYLDGHRQVIVSAKPQGIVGKVIAREEETYATGFSLVELPNPYKDNATTIIAERGTILHGRPIQGRVFMEFMDYDHFQRGFLPEDKVKNKFDGAVFPIEKWIGNGGDAGSTWSFDDRRQRKVLINLIVQRLKFNDRGQMELVNLETQYAEFEDGEYIHRPYYPMHARGLNWLSLADTLAPGTVKVYIPSMEVRVTAPNPGFSKTRNVGGTVNGPMRLDLEARDTRSFPTGNVREKALPIVVNLDMKGTGKVVRVPAATLDMSMLNTTISAGGDKITVYLEREDTIKLFLKEDN
jgi:hypothetical protein